MFESLTRYLAGLETVGEHGALDGQLDGNRPEEAQLSGSYESYGRTIDGISRAIYEFAEEHPDYNLYRYSDVLEANGLSWDGRVMSEADVSELDGQAVTALIIAAVRAERFCDGALLGFFENGSMRRWLQRLRDIDEQGVSREPSP